MNKKIILTTATIALLAVVGSTTVNANTETSVHKTALEVIRGEHGNGSDRRYSLKAHGFDFKTVQDEVNSIMSRTKKNATEAKQKGSGSKTKTTLNMAQTSGQVNIEALANYMVSNTVNAAGYSASEWAYIIEHESNGQADIANASSGAYGCFQLLGHGEYSGMPLFEQIDMASKLPAGSWVVYP